MMKKMFNKIDTMNAPLEGYNLIEASAGTGKTHTITNLFLRLLLEKSVPLKKILVVTFTEAATDELKVRIRKVLSESKKYIETGNPHEEMFVRLFENLDKNESLSKINEAIINFDEASIFTIHGFCHKILRETAFSSGNLFDVELVTNQNKFIDSIVYDFWRKNLFSGSVLFTQYLTNQVNPDFFYRLMGNSPFLDLNSFAERYTERGFWHRKKIFHFTGRIERFVEWFKRKG